LIDTLGIDIFKTFHGLSLLDQIASA
jgi:hypothetical protein